jgi:hypothetical protein
MSFPGEAQHVTDANTLIDAIPEDATDEEMNAALLQAFGVYALGEIEELGIPENAAKVLVDTFTPFAQGLL